MKLQPPELANVQCEVCHGYATQSLNDGKLIPTLKRAMALCMKRHMKYCAADFQKNAKMDPIKHQVCERTLFISTTRAGHSRRGCR